MIILGIDPGYAIVGWGVIEKLNNGKCKVIDYGAILTDKDLPLPERLVAIDNSMEKLIDHFKPSDLAIEELFFNTNTTTAIKVAEARGVVITKAQKMGVKIYEYTPLQIKQGLTGYGRAEKSQIQFMTKTLLGLSKVPKPDDTADALAVALTHAQTNNTIKSNLLI
ncbi:MAG: crossover junction endodeoxyribonuclease RuvC [Clostridia bacterium]|nr:crossover junction endodeoxyribonuclease RuvC [Clostridia bacterium]